MTDGYAPPDHFRFAGRIAIRPLLLIAAILLYGAAGSPTPDNPGMVEALIGALLLLAAGPSAAASILQPRTPWRRAGLALALYGLTVPVIGGLAYGAGLTAILRDIIPFLFLLLPFFADIRQDEGPRTALTAAVAAAGVMFAARVAGPLLGHESFWQRINPDDPFYLANAPTVLFAALLLTGLAGRELYSGAGIRRLGRAAMLAAAAFLPFAAMMLVTQRASMGVMAAYAGFFLLCALVRNPRRAVLPLLAALAVAIVGWEVGAQIIRTALEKTALVGVNMRWEEATAVFDRLGGHILAILFGRGWGATVASPAVGGMTVNFTHSLLTSYWLKTGLCGLALVLLYLFRLGVLLTQILRVHPLLAAAIAGPLLIDVTLYASFKSLDFGLILLLIPLWAEKLHETREAYSISPNFQ